MKTNACSCYEWPHHWKINASDCVQSDVEEQLYNKPNKEPKRPSVLSHPTSHVFSTENKNVREDSKRESSEQQKRNGGRRQADFMWLDSSGTLPAGLERCQIGMLTHKHRKHYTQNAPSEVLGRAKVTWLGNGRVTMPTGLTDVTVANYVRGCWKDTEGGEGPGVVSVCARQCVPFGGRVAGPVCVLGSQMESGPRSTRWQADIEKHCIVQYGAVVGQETH